jgi:hypothetical protein
VEATLNSSKRLSIGVIVACVALLGAAVFGGVADAKKKKSKSATVTKAVNLPVPDHVNGPPARNGLLDVPLEVGKKFKNKTANVVKVTYQMAGLGAMDDIGISLISPEGRTVFLNNPGIGTDLFVGPLTLTPNTAVDTCTKITPPCEDPHATLNRPYQGTAGDNSLALLTGQKMKGTWTLEFQDFNTGNIATIQAVSINITPQKPIV